MENQKKDPAIADKNDAAAVGVATYADKSFRLSLASALLQTLDVMLGMGSKRAYPWQLSDGKPAVNIPERPYTNGELGFVWLWVKERATERAGNDSVSVEYTIPDAKKAKYLEAANRIREKWTNAQFNATEAGPQSLKYYNHSKAPALLDLALLRTCVGTQYSSLVQPRHH